MKFKDYTQKRKDSYVKSAKQLELLILEKFGWRCHLGFGSLLGSVREGKLIDGDYDIDLCFIIPEEDKYNATVKLFTFLNKKGLLKRIFYQNGCWQDHPKKFNNPLYGQAHILINGHIIDLFAAWIKDGQYWTVQWGNIGSDLGELVSPLENNTFKIPADYNTILTNLYGSWEKPEDTHPSKYKKRKCHL